MALTLHKNIGPDSEIGVWKVEEDNSFFLSKLDIYSAEKEILSNLSDRKKREYLASRYLLHVMSGRKIRGACLKDDLGKPYLEGSTHKISFSHSGSYVSVAASKQDIGIDIQLFVDKIARIQHKFVNEREAKFPDGLNPLHALHFIWGAKESLFKAYGRKNVDFKKHLNVKILSYDKTSIIAEGFVDKSDYQKSFTLNAEILENYLLVYAIEKL